MIKGIIPGRRERKISSKILLKSSIFSQIYKRNIFLLTSAISKFIQVKNQNMTTCRVIIIIDNNNLIIDTKTIENIDDGDRYNTD